MRFNSLYFAGCMLLVCACSNPNKKAEVAVPSTATTTAATAAPTPAPTPAVAELKNDGTTCKKGNDLRVLEIEPSKPKGCQLWYSISGNRKSIASSSHGNAHCEKVRDKIGSKLKTSGYECVTTQTLPASTSTAAPAVVPVTTATPQAVIPAATPKAVATPVPSSSTPATPVSSSPATKSEVAPAAAATPIPSPTTMPSPTKK